MAHDTAADKAPSLDSCFDAVRALIDNAVANPTSFHDFEQALLAQVLAIGRAATHALLAQLGAGDLGESLTLPDGRTVTRLAELHRRSLTGVFGSFTLERTGYGARPTQKIDFVPLDNRLQLPASKFSYLLQDFNNLLVTDDPFEHVAEVLQRILHLQQHVDSLERQSQHTAAHVEPFRNAQDIPPWQEEGAILVQSADAKGVPMRTAADAPPIHSHAHKRGPKTGRKKQAIVGAVYSVEPLVRTPEEIVELLFRDPAEAGPAPARSKRPAPCYKRVMARLNEYSDAAGASHDGMAEVFAWLSAQLDERNPLHDKVVVNLMDGDERFVAEQKRHVVNGPQVDILDLLHVTSRVWKVAGLFAATNSAAAQERVRSWVGQILRGQVQAVVRDMRRQGAAARLGGNKKKELDKACAYMQKRKGKMRYHEYLKAGYPIASGVIEGACRHYVKDRMERTGMSWKQPGAQAMLELRSVALNDTWDEFQAFYRQRETAQRYPHRQLLDALVWPLAQAA
jgi:hypothetical protein